ncbi:MAG: IS200/IS605 family transposase [Thermoguttaceae bacterium]
MAQSLTQIIVHAVFSTKNREQILSPDIRAELFSYIGGILKSLDCVLLEINGTNDHVHLLLIQSKNFALAKIFEEVKGASSRWMETKSDAYKTFSWQGGYGAFSAELTR